MSRASLTVAYDGPALRDHAMDVRDLAPALLGFGQLFDAANAALNGDATRIKVQVKATEPGCFQITFEVVGTLGEHLVALLSSQPISAATNLITLLGFGSGATVGLFALIKRLKGGKIEKVDHLANNMVRLSIGTETIDVPVNVLRLYQDIAVRGAVQRVVEDPLKKEGIDSFEVSDAGVTVFKISTDEAASFSRPQVPDEILIDQTQRSAFSIISLAFKEDNKWRLNDGTNAISAVIDDDDFLAKVDANQVSFSKGDILICDVRVVQRQIDAGLKTDYTVVRVVEHRPAARQLPLPLPSQVRNPPP